MKNNIENNYATCNDCKKLLPKVEMVGMYDGDSIETSEIVIWICEGCLKEGVTELTGLQSPKKLWR